MPPAHQALKRECLCINPSDLPRSRLILPRLTFDELGELACGNIRMKSEILAGIEFDKA
jgi:hypothetical protein